MLGGALPMSLLHDTTRVSVDKTVGDLDTCLASRGATALMCAYDANGHVIALRFNVGVGPQDLAFRLPADWWPVLALLARDRKVPRGQHTLEQDLRVSWRILKDGVEAQLASVDTKMAALEQVCFLDAIMPDGRALRDRPRGPVSLPARRDACDVCVDLSGE
jgi:hypothetical protein